MLATLESVAKQPNSTASRAVPLNAQPIPGSGMGVAALPTKDVHHTPVPQRETLAVRSEAPPSSSSSSVLTQQQTAETVRPTNNALSFSDQSVRPSSQISATNMPSSSVAVMPGLPLSSAVTMGNLQHTSSAAVAPHTSSGAGGYMHSANMQGAGLLQGGGVSKMVTGAQAAVHTNAQVATHTSAQAVHSSEFGVKGWVF